MSVSVYLCPFGGNARRSLPQRLVAGLRQAGLPEVVAKGSRVAVKVHWGEPGNVTFVPSALVRAIVREVARAGGRPFVTDTNTLYAGHRSDALSNLEAAAAHGYTHHTLGAPVLVADGLTGGDWRSVPAAGQHLNEVKVAGAIADADALVTVSHAKGHILFGFGGALKNLGMGCVSGPEKHRLHCHVKPHVDPRRCVGCALCRRHCPADAIILEEQGAQSVARIDPERCSGCGECIVHCPHQAIPIGWETVDGLLQQKTAEAVAGVLAGKMRQALFVNMLFDITRDCDCCSWSGLPLVANIGILLSRDPVAIDQAALDLIDQAPIVPGGELDTPALRQAPQRLGALHGHSPLPLLEHAERLGIGSRSYELVEVA